MLPYMRLFFSELLRGQKWMILHQDARRGATGGTELRARLESATEEYESKFP